MRVRFQEQRNFDGVDTGVYIIVCYFLYIVKSLFHREPAPGLDFGLFMTTDDMGSIYGHNAFAVPYSRPPT